MNITHNLLNDFKKAFFPSLLIGFFNFTLFPQSIDILREAKWIGFLKKQNAS